MTRVRHWFWSVRVMSNICSTQIQHRHATHLEVCFLITILWTFPFIFKGILKGEIYIMIKSYKEDKYVRIKANRESKLKWITMTPYMSKLRSLQKNDRYYNRSPVHCPYPPWYASKFLAKTTIPKHGSYKLWKTSSKMQRHTSILYSIWTHAIRNRSKKLHIQGYRRACT